MELCMIFYNNNHAKLGAYFKQALYSFSVLFFVALPALSAAAVTDKVDTIQYNYADLRYVFDAELDEINLDGDGFGFSASLRLDEMFYILGDYEVIDYDANVETSIFQAGVGAIFPTRPVDVIAEFVIVDADSEQGLDGYDDTGFRVSGGVRAYVATNFELRGTLNYLDISDDDTYFTLAGDYFVNRSLSVNFSKDLSAEIDRFSIGLRYYLGE